MYKDKSTTTFPFIVPNSGEYYVNFQILESHIETLSENDTFGRVVSGGIKFRGELIRLEKGATSELWWVPENIGGYRLSIPGLKTTLYLDVIHDNHGRLTKETELASLITCRNKVIEDVHDERGSKTGENTNYNNAGLVMAKLGKDTYHRIGHFMVLGRRNRNIITGGICPLEKSSVITIV
jgi:hypothetical protein